MAEQDRGVDMRPHLIVDFSDCAFCALLVTTSGQLLPCSHEVRRVATRSFSPEVLFDPAAVAEEFAWDEAVEAAAKAAPRDFFQRARRLGLQGLGSRRPAVEALRLSSPLAVLSSPAALVDPTVRPLLPGVAVRLLAALFEPVFSFLDRCGVRNEDIDPIVVVPACTGHLGELALQKVFRRRGFRRLTILSRDVAAVLALLEEPSDEYLVCDTTAENLHLHRVAITADGGRRQLSTIATRTVRGLGWGHWVRQIASALGASGHIPDSPAALLPALDRALIDLCSGAPQEPIALPCSSSLHLTHGLLQEVLDSGRWRGIVDLEARVSPALEALRARGLPAILLGAVCGLEGLPQHLLAVVGGTQPTAVARMPVLERTIRSVAAALLWLRARSDRRIEVPPSGSLRLNTFNGEACELLAAEHLPRPGEQCCLQWSCRFVGDGEAGRQFPVHLMWGADPAPEGNATLCALPIELGAGPDGERLLRLALRLRRSDSGRRLGISVESRLDPTATAGRAERAFFTRSLAAFPPPRG